MKALLLAAGKGTRLGALTESTPKPMLPVAGEPLLAHTVRRLVSAGITQIAINLHHAGEQVVRHFGSGAALGAEIVYSHEPTLMGTAGAAKLLEWFLDERFAVIYGDVFSNVDVRALEASHVERCLRFGGDHRDQAVTIALYQVPNPWECGLVDVDLDGRVLRFVEKPPRSEVFTDLANAGIQIVEPGLLRRIPSGIEQDFGRDVLPAMIREELPLFAQPIGAGEYVVDIGTPSGYARAEALALGSLASAVVAGRPGER